MAKTIKFNLILDDYPARTIEDVQEHFSIEDILEYFQNGLLLRWLNVRGYKEQHDAVAALSKNATGKETILSLVKIFEISEVTAADIDETIGVLEYLEAEKAQNAQYQEGVASKKQIIDDYLSGYAKLVSHMKENKHNLAVLKADAFQMEHEYLELFHLHAHKLYFYLKEVAPMAIFPMLTRDKLRQVLTQEDDIDADIRSLKSKAKDIFGNQLKVIRRNTRSTWDKIEDADKKVFVIFISPNSYVRTAGSTSEERSTFDVRTNITLLDGLEYKSYEANCQLWYMEV